MKEPDYSYFLIPGSNDDKLNIRFRENRGHIEYFVIQYTALIKSRWHEIMRFDTCHGYAHRHTYHLQSEEYIIDLTEPGDNLDIVFTESLEYIKQNFQKIKRNYLNT